MGRLARNARDYSLERVAGLRALFLTRDASAIAPEIAAHRALKPTLDSLYLLTASTPTQRTRVDDIRVALAQWDTAYAMPALRSIRAAAPGEVPHFPAASSENAIYTPVREAFAAFVAAEEEYYAQRLALTRKLERAATIAVLAELLLLTCVLGFLTRRATLQTGTLLEQQQQLEEQAIELEMQAADLQDQAVELEHQVDEAQELAAQLEETQESLTTAVASANAARNAEATARQELVGVLSRMTDGIIALDAEWRLVYQNEAATAMTNRPVNEQVGHVFWEARPWLVRTDVERQFRHAMETQTPVWFEQRETDGREVGASVEVHAFPSPDGLSIFLRDVTTQRSLEAQFRQAQKMEAVGQLAGGIAHDFNNLLTAIRSYSELLLEDLPPDGTAHGDVLQIRAASDRAAALTRQLLAYSRKQVVQSAVVDLAAIATGVTEMLQRLIGPEIELSTQLPDEPWMVLADPGHVEQVIVNLVVNARDAMPKGGRLSIGITNRTVRAGELQCPDAAGDFVCLAVSDSGTGMTDSTRSRIFDPFFTTKDSGKGTGLGLSTVLGIVKQSSGHITVDSEIGRGTTFTSLFPRHLDSARGGAYAIVPAQRPALAEPRPNQLILVIDDEPAICSAVERILARQGYRVLVAGTAAMARQLASDHPGEIDLVLGDIMMPGINGRDLVEEVRAIQPQAKVIFMSGFTDDAVKLQGILDQGTTFIPKPFALDEVVRKVRETLGLGQPAIARGPAA